MKGNYLATIIKSSFCSCELSPTVSSQIQVSTGLERAGLESENSCSRAEILHNEGCIHEEMSNTFKHHDDAACHVKWVIAESMHVLSYFFPFPQHTGWKSIIQLVYVKRQTGCESVESSPSQSIQFRLKKQSHHSQICPWFGADYYRMSLSVKGDKDISILCKVLCDPLSGSTCLYILYKYIYV